MADPTLATTTNAPEQTTIVLYSAVGWPTSVQAPLVGKTRYRYDRVGNLVKRLAPLGRVTQYTYDAAGRALTQTDALGRVSSMSYDVVGNVIEAVKPSGTMTVGDTTDGAATYVYDEANRLTGTTFSDATAGFTYDYTPAGRGDTAARVQASTMVSSSVLTYDDAGRVVAAVNTGGVDSDANYAYTPAGRLSGVSFSTGMSAPYDYNTVGELTQVTSSGVGGVPVVNYAYDPAGRVTKVTRQGQTALETTVGYDLAGQLESLQHASGSTVVEGFDVTRDVLGNPTQVTTTTGGTQSSALFAYDPADRLKFECYPATGETCTNRSPRVTYKYDKVGNRVVQKDRTVSGNKATTVKTASVYDAGDQLVSQSINGVDTVNNTWSPNGELATSTTSAGTSTFTNDLTGELVSAALADGTVVDYTHDVGGNRTSRSVDGVLDASWAWDGSGGLPVRIGEYDAGGQLETAWLPDPTSPTGAPLAATTGTVSSWLLSDPFANLTTTIDTAASAVSGTRTMSVFGAELAPATGAMVDGAFGFAGQYLDSTTGLYDMRARDYDPSHGRFTANDPIAVPTGMPYFSGYTYGFNNPTVFVDPLGLFSFDDAWTYAAAVVDSTWDMGWEMQARSPSSMLFTPNRFAKAFNSDVDAMGTDVEEYGWLYAVDSRINPVHQLLDAGDAWIQAVKAEDWNGAGRAAPGVVVSAASVCAVGFGGAKFIKTKLPSVVPNGENAFAADSAAVSGVPKTSPNFKPPTNSPQLPPTEIPAGWKVREMPPTADYPNGYWKLEKPMADGSWQPIDPSTMKPGTRPETHVPFPEGG